MLFAALFGSTYLFAQLLETTQNTPVQKAQEALISGAPMQKLAPTSSYNYKFIARISSAKMCPGEEADINIYLQQATPTQKNSAYNDDLPYNIATIGLEGYAPATIVQFGLWFADTSVVEPVPLQPGVFNASGYIPVVPFMHPFLKSHGLTAYNYIMNNSTPPGFSQIRFVWTYVPPHKDNIPTFIPDTNTPFFSVRVKMKKEGDASIYWDTMFSYMGFGMNAQDLYWSMFFGAIEPNSAYHIPTDIVQADFLHANPPFIKKQHIGGRVTLAEKPVVYAGPDTAACVQERIFLSGATGGAGYKWELIDGDTDCIVSSRDVQVPAFRAPKPGIYQYQVKITDNRGCYSFDTMQITVHPNTISASMAHDSIVDSNTVFPFVADITSGNPPPLGLSYEPAGQIDGTFEFSTLANTLHAETKSVPMSEPLLFSATSSDLYCTREDPVLVNVRGSNVEGYISNFPIVRCGDDVSETQTTLYLITIGGSEKLQYKWHAMNMQAGTQNPVFLNGDTVRNPVVKFYGQCCFTVDIYDPETDRTVVISDTVDKVAPVIVENFIERTGDNVICHGESETFIADLKNIGTSPTLQWRVNSRIVLESNNPADTVFTPILHKGDTVSLVVYSSDICAVNSPLVSNIIVPPTAFYSDMQSTLGYGPGYTEACTETEIMLEGIFWGMGKRFRLTWMRNNSVYNSEIVTGMFDAGGESVRQKVPRSNFYDEYLAIATEANAPCLLRDTAYSDIILVKRHADAPIKAGNPITYDDYINAQCSGLPITLYADGIENLGESFLLFWLKKSGGVVDTIGYYINRKENTSDVGKEVTMPEYPPGTWETSLNNRYIQNLAVIYSLYDATYNPTPMLSYSPLNWFRNRFPLCVNDPNTNIYTNNKSVIANGDSIYYQINTIYHTGTNCSGKVFNTAESSKKAIVYFVGAPGALQIAYKDPVTCENTPVTYIAKASNDGGVGRFEWKFNGDPIGSRGYTSPRGDTLYLTSGVVNGTTISCICTTTFPCATGFPVSDDIVASGLNSNSGGTVRGDTLVCNGDTAHVFMINYSPANTFVDFAETVGGLNLTPAPSVSGSKNSLDFVPAAGGSWFYYRLHYIPTGCDYIDSAFVEARPDKNVKIVLSVDPVGKFGGGDTMVWCTSDEMLEFRFDAYYEDKPGHDTLLDPSLYTFNWAFKTPSNQAWTYYGGTSQTRTQNRRHPESGGNTMRIRIQDIKEINSCRMGEHFSNTIHYVFLDPTEFSSAMHASYILCDTGAGGNFVTALMKDTVRTSYNYLWLNPLDGSIAGTSKNLDISSIAEQKFRLFLYVRDRDSACPEINTHVDVTRGVLFPSHLYTNNSALDMDMFKVSTGEKIIAPVFCQEEDSVYVKMVFRPHIRSTSVNDRYTVYERPASGTAGQIFVRETAPGDSIYMWFHRSFARSYIEHRIDTIGCASPDNYSWLEIYDPYGEGKSHGIQPHAVYAKHDAVASFEIGPDSAICDNNLVPIALTATGTSLASDGFVWLPAAGLALSDTSSPNIVVNPTATTVYKGVLRLGDGCYQYDSAVIEVFSDDSSAGAHVKISSVIPFEDGILPACGTGDSISVSINTSASSTLVLFKRAEWYINGVLVAQRTDNLAQVVRLPANNGDSVHVKMYLTDNLKQCALDTEFVSNVCAVKVFNEPAIVAAADTSICAGDNASLVFGGNGTVYLLYIGATKIDSSSTGRFTVAPSATTTYTAHSYSEWDNCYASADATVTVWDIVAPTVSISASYTKACAGDSITYSVDTASPYNTYIWYVNGVAAGVTDSLYHTVLGEYDTVQCKAVYGGAECIRPEDSVAWSNKISISAGNYPSLRRLLPVLAADTFICEGKSVTLLFDVSAGANVSWEPSTLGSNPQVTVTPSATTTYHVQAWFNPLCAVSDTVRVTVYDITHLPAPSITISSNSPAEICGGDSNITYTVTSCDFCDSIVWYAGGQRLSIASGVGSSITRIIGIGYDTVYALAYHVKTAECDSETDARSNLAVINRQTPPKVSISPRDTTINEGEKIVLSATGAAHFTWGPAIYFANSITGSPVVAEPSETAQIYVTGYDYFFCTGMDEITVTVIQKQNVIDSNFVYIPNSVVLSSSNNEDRIFTVRGLKVQAADIKIYNTNGGLVFSENGLIPERYSIPVWEADNTPTGNYNYKITVRLSDGEIKQFKGWISVIK